MRGQLRVVEGLHSVEFAERSREVPETHLVDVPQSFRGRRVASTFCSHRHSFHVFLNVVGRDVGELHDKAFRARRSGLLKRDVAPQRRFDREALSLPDVIGDEIFALLTGLGSDLWRNVPVVALVELGSSVVDVEMIDTEIAEGKGS